MDLRGRGNLPNEDGEYEIWTGQRIFYYVVGIYSGMILIIKISFKTKRKDSVNTENQLKFDYNIKIIV